MSTENCDGEHKHNIWAPWRMQYINSLGGKEEGCFICRYVSQPADDEKNLVLWRGRHCLALLNRFPYTGGHSMVAPFSHSASLAELADEVMLEMMQMVRDLQAVLQEAVHPQGFNVGINLGRCAGAGLPGHIHMHIVPRWQGDTNFMPVLGDVHVIPQALEELYKTMRAASDKLELPRLS